MNKILIINTGSQSKKYSFFFDDERQYSAHFEFENGKHILNEDVSEKYVGHGDNPSINKMEISSKDFVNSIAFIINRMINFGVINHKKDVNVLGVRIVASGSYFQEHKRIDKEYIKKLGEAMEKAPLHLKSAIEEVESAKKVLGKDIKIIGVSDTAFHKTIPAENKYYAIPMKDSLKYDIKKFGYHGISIESILSKIRNGSVKDRAGKEIELPEKVIICHLGGGASVTAVLKGQSVYNSMGFTPLEGLVMATRVGNVDAGVVAYLAKKIGVRSILGYLNGKCGLLGVSGKSNDIRELLQNEKHGGLENADSALALKMYVGRARAVIAEAVSVLGGVDMIVFSGTVGERSFIMRERICDGLGYLGVKIDKDHNNKSEGVETIINEGSSSPVIAIVKTDETSAMVQAVRVVVA